MTDPYPLLAEELLACTDETRTAWFETHPSALMFPLADALRQHYLTVFPSNSQQAQHVVTTLHALATYTADPLIVAEALWTEGLAALHLNNQPDVTISKIDQAVTLLMPLARPDLIAQTQVSKIAALAMVGDYGQAVTLGETVLAQFEALGDEVGAGKVELNLANLHHRQGKLGTARRLFRRAHARFLALNDTQLTMMAENGWANVLSLQHRFGAALDLYKRALARAESLGADYAAAMIEGNIGSLALFQDQYGQALHYLNRSQRRYAELGDLRDAAEAQQDLADAYLELNMVSDAAEIYTQLAQNYRDLGLQAELAHILTQHARAVLRLQQQTHGLTLLDEARSLYELEENPVGMALTDVIAAQATLHEGHYNLAVQLADSAAHAFREAETWGRWLLARWLAGEAHRMAGDIVEAQETLETVLAEARQQAAPQIVQRCLTSLGLMMAQTGQNAEANDFFREAVAVIEALRAPLPGDSFRTAFLADNLTPYIELVRLCLNGDEADSNMNAFMFAERARARALNDLVGAPPQSPASQEGYDGELLARRQQLRAELNYYYSQFNRPGPDQTTLAQEVQRREKAIAEIERQLQQTGAALDTASRPDAFDLAALQAALGADTTLVAYFNMGTEWVAFVVSPDSLGVVRKLANPSEIETALQKLRFQLETIRYGQNSLAGHQAQLIHRTRFYLSQLYDLLLRPLESHLQGRNLVIVPHRELHYIPFHALYDGQSYMAEGWDVSYAPSATMLLHTLQQTVPVWEKALLVGVPDENTPDMLEEIAALQPLFPQSAILVEAAATMAAVRAAAAQADLVHLACHGQFRPDNPLFSALHLGDGWLTVYDTYEWTLRAGLVTLSACETGMSDVAPGDELLGLARGFFSAGAPSLVVSLWNVDDGSTAELMAIFYNGLRDGLRPAAALAAAQRRVMVDYPHPAYWSPFVLLGRY